MVAPPTGGGNESVSYTIKIEIQEAKKALEDIIKSEGTLDEKTRRIGTLILEWSKSTGNSISVVTKAFRELAAEGTKDLVKLGGEAAKTQKNLEGLAPAVRGASQGSSGFTSSLSSLGSVAQFVFGSVLGITAVSALRNLVNWFGEATDAALAFSKVQIELQVGVRAQQRLGLDVTLADYEKKISEFQAKYPIFSRQQVYEGYSNALLLTKSLQLTEDEFQNLINVAASASVVLGRDFGETATGIAKSLSSGWFEAAQRAGLLISRQRVVDEGLRMNIENAKNGYNAMTEYERAIAALSVYVRENKSIEEDVGAVMQSQAAQVSAATAAWQNFKQTFGALLSPFKAAFASTIVPVLQELDELNQGALTGLARLVALVGTLVQVLGQAIQKLKEFTAADLLKSPRDFFGDIDASAIFKNLEESIRQYVGLEPLLKDTGKEAGLALGEGIEEGLDENNFADAFAKLGYDIEDELIRMADRMKQLWVDLQRKIADILADESRAIAKENADYAQKVETENLNVNRRIAESNAKYRLNEIDAEAKFQEQMRQLRTRFLFDLEDALRERDARQVLRLSRQYQMDKTNAETEFRLEQEARARAHQLELQQIAAEHAERLRVLAEEHAQEIAQIHDTAAQRRLEAQQQYEQELADLKAQTDARLAQKIRDFLREYKLTEAQAKQLVRMLDKYFGKNGQVAQMYNNLAGYILGMIQLIQESLNALSGIGGTNTRPYAPAGTAPRYAKGGTLIATKPTQAVFGEAGAEIATFTPINQISQHQQNVDQAINSISQSRPAGSPSGMLRLFLGLSPDLRVDIMNDTLYEVSTIVEEVNRTR